MKKRKIISSIYSRDLLDQANNISDDLWDFQNKLVGDPRLSDFFTVEDIEAMDRVRAVLDEFAVQRDDINSSTCSASRSITAGKVFDYDISEEAIKNNGGSLHIGDYVIEIGRLYDRKTNSYNGGFGKKTTVYNDATGLDKVFNSPQSAIEFLKKQLKGVPQSNSITAGKVFDYDSYVTYNHGPNKFSVHMKYVDDPENFQCQISMIRPYDDADYAWARKWSPRDVDIIQNGKVVDHYTVPEYDYDTYEDGTEYVDTVIDMICTALLDYNRDIQPRMIHN